MGRWPVSGRGLARIFLEHGGALPVDPSEAANGRGEGETPARHSYRPFAVLQPTPMVRGRSRKGREQRGCSCDQD